MLHETLVTCKQICENNLFWRRFKKNLAGGPPLWDACDEAEPKVYFDAEPDWGVGEYGPDEDVDQSVNW